MAPQRTPLLQSMQLRLVTGYVLIIAVLLVLLNTYPLLMIQNLMFRAQQGELTNQVRLVLNSLTTADELTAETLEQAIAPLKELDADRVLVTDGAGLVLYDTGESPASGKYVLTGEIVSALRGNDAFSSRYEDGTFRSRAASPVMTRGSVVGAVCLCRNDGSQGSILEQVSSNMRMLSLVVVLVVLAIFVFFSGSLTRRVNTLLGGIRTVRAGEYTHRVSMKGNDQLAQLADEFNQLTGRLQANEEERRRFVSDASHELKTPLASIRLLTDTILQDEDIDRDTVREFVADIGEAADRLIHISQDLLALNRLDEGRRLNRERVDVNLRAEQVRRMLAPLAKEDAVTVETAYGADCFALCDPEDMSQILRNLIENAIKYNVPGGTVTVTTRREEDRVLLEVADTGLGIPEEDRERIFQRFYRVDKARSRAAGGSGLGLSIVLDAVRLHGGTVDVRAGEENRGTVFTVTLPAWREEEGQ